jgi:predicted MFS family arabinose efflux permease
MSTASPDQVTYRRVLAVREFQALLLSQGLSLMGDQVARIAIALLVFERTGSAFAASATYACSYLTWLVGGPFLSAVADRYPRRTVMVVCDLLRAALIPLLIVPGLPLWAAFVVLILVGLLEPPFDSSRSATLPDVLSEQEYPIGNALMNVLLQGGQAAGFLLGGLLVAAFGTNGALMVDAATFVVSAVLVAVWVKPRMPGLTSTERTSLLREAAQGVTAVRRHPTLRWLLAWGLLGSAATIAPEGLAVAVASGRGDGPAVAGLLTASVPIGFLVGCFLLLRLVSPERRLATLPWFGVLCCVPLLFTPVVDVSWGIALLWVAAGAGSVLQLVASTAYIAAAPRALRGRAYGVAVSGLMATQGLVLLAAGAVAEQVDPRMVVSVIALLCLVLMPAVIRLSPDHGHDTQATAAGGRRTGG